MIGRVSPCHNSQRHLLPSLQTATCLLPFNLSPCHPVGICALHFQPSKIKKQYLLCMYQKHFYVYILINSLKPVLYTGVTNDLQQRIIEHYQNRGQQQAYCGR